MSYNNGPRIVTDGLMLYLDAANTKSYSGTGTTWYDLSGNNNNATLVNGLTFSAANRGSIIFDGTNDYISINKTISDFGITSNATLCCWMNISLLSRWTGLVGFSSIVAYGATAANFSLDLNPTNNIRIWKNNSVVFGGEIIPNNTWNLFTITSSAEGFSFYFNKSFIVSGSAAGNITSTNNLIIGDNWDSNLQGYISCVSLYNKTLNVNEINQNYNAIKGRFNL